MTFAEIQTAFDESPCVGLLTESQRTWLKIKLQWDIFNGASTPMTMTDIQTLFTESPCIGTLSQGTLDQLDVLTASGAGGGGGGLLQGAGPPTGGIYDPPTNPTLTYVYYDTIAGVFYAWNVTSQAWV